MKSFSRGASICPLAHWMTEFCTHGFIWAITATPPLKLDHTLLSPLEKRPFLADYIPFILLYLALCPVKHGPVRAESSDFYPPL